MGEMLNKWLKMKREPPVIEEAILNISVTSSLVKDKLERVCQKFGITAAQYNVMRILKGVYPEGHPRCEIFTRMIERAPDITRLIDRLEKLELVERDRTDDDRRKSITRITKKGINLLNKLIPLMDEKIKEFGKKLTEKEAKAMSNYCEKLYADLI